MKKAILKKCSDKRAETLTEALVSVLIISLTMAFFTSGLMAAARLCSSRGPEQLVFSTEGQRVIDSDFEVTVTYRSSVKKTSDIVLYQTGEEGADGYLYYRVD
ncbi:MAG: hypothetical protein HUJ80_07690 [Firmicutes bacterium]|nr:hypothetical protein [Bacillota bacterium]